MKLSWEVIELKTKRPFVTARGEHAVHRNVLVRLEDKDGVVGWGEAAPNGYFGQSVAGIIEALDSLNNDGYLKECDFREIDSIEADLEIMLAPDMAVKSAISAALHDMHGKWLNVPVWRMWGLDADLVPNSSYTISIGSLQDIRERVEEASGYPILKVKLGTDYDEEILRTIREMEPNKMISVDANAGWKSLSHAAKMMEMLGNYGVEFVEQPMPPENLCDYEDLAKLEFPTPIVADESCKGARDIPKLQGLFDGINIKMGKCGSLTEAMAMVHTARACDMYVMAGCMIETSLGISTIAQIAPLLDWADFDGAALLSKDPFQGVSMEDGEITLNSEPGLGVSRILPSSRNQI